MAHIAVLGVFVADTAYRADRAPNIGETILGNSFALGPGGKGSNQAVAAARAGGETHMITRLGRDTFADLAISTWKDAGVIPAITQHDAATGAAYIFIEEATGNNAIIICPGVAAGISPADIDAQADLIGTASVFVTQLEQPMEAAIRGLEVARAGGATTILNPAPAAQLPAEIYPLCDVMTPNESESEGITGIMVTDVASAEKAARALRDMGVGTAIITLGENGVLLVDRDGAHHQPVISAGPVVETTGAGDAFNGGLAVALSERMTMRNAVRFGCATAGISVTRPGTAPSMPTRAEIDALLAAL
ncbi:MAG: ribokinase [Silicimonas sp.]|nr:ribokinase [Silicimonas sp.]